MRPALGAFIYINWNTPKARVIQSRPDTWANKALAQSLDADLKEKDDEKILWFDQGAGVIAERKPIAHGATRG